MTVAVEKRGKSQYSKVVPLVSRNNEFEPFQIFVNDKGLPEAVSNQPYQTADNSKFGFDETTHKTICNDMNKTLKRKKMQRVEMLNQIRISGINVGKSIGENKAKQLLKYYVEIDAITQHGKNRSPKVRYQMNADYFS
jgi:hypothetical protein